MPSRRPLATAGAFLSLLAARCAALALQPGPRQRPRAFSAWKPLWQPEGVPKVKYGRSYVFITHHKTGTNLMQRLCNETALLLTGGRDECAFCLSVLPPDWRGYVGCVPDPTPLHGSLRGTFNRFTVVSNMNRRQFEIMRKFAPDFRAIHMIREPSKLVMSAFQYDTYLQTPQGKSMRWDTYVNLTKLPNIEDQLRAETLLLLPELHDMRQIHRISRTDDRVLTLDLETFKTNYDDTVSRMWQHMLDNVTKEEMRAWLNVSRAHDTQWWPASLKRRPGPAAPSTVVNSSEAERALHRLEKKDLVVKMALR